MASITAILVAKTRLAEVERRKAERHLKVAHRAVNELGLATTDRLGDIPGAEYARSEMLTASLQYYDSFLTYARDKPELRLDAARTVFK